MRASRTSWDITKAVTVMDPIVSSRGLIDPHCNLQNPVCDKFHVLLSLLAQRAVRQIEAETGSLGIPGPLKDEDGPWVLLCK